MDHWILSVVAAYRRAPLMAAGGLDEALGAFCDSFLARQLALRHGFVFVRQVLGTWYVQAESYSRATSRDTSALHRLVGLARQQIESAEGNGFPAGYGAVFDRRARFAAARLALEDAKLDTNLVVALARLPWPGRLALRAALALPGKAGRLAALVTLAIWLRPTSLVGLAATALRRRAASAADRVPG
jgi:hypothetical protein